MALKRENDLYKLSVIVPVYNTEKYLKDCLNSIVNQTYKNYEVLLVDDGSTDDSARICDEYRKNYSQVKVIHKKNEGVSAARNDAMKIATGDYYIFVDSDDTLDLSMFEHMMLLADGSGTDLIMCDAYRFAENVKHEINYCQELDDIYYDTKDICKILLGKSCVLWNKIIGKKILEQEKFTNGIKYGEDMLLFSSLYPNISSIKICRKYLYFYRANRLGSVVANSILNDSYMDFLQVTSKCIDELNRYKLSDLQVFRTMDCVSRVYYAAYHVDRKVRAPYLLECKQLLMKIKEIVLNSKLKLKLKWILFSYCQNLSLLYIHYQKK